MKRAKLVGAGGYGGVGLTELLLRHPETDLACLVDIQDQGRTIGTLYPHLAGFCDLPIVGPDDPAAQEPYDVVFFATPDRVGQRLARAEWDRGACVIDYSGDFRFNDPAAYADYAGRLGLPGEHADPGLLPRAVYGLAELHREELRGGARLAGNPGCFAVSCILGLAPAVKEGLVSPDSLICDCKTGVSGAGKKPHSAFHYPARYDHMNAYKLGGHQHVCEIEHELGRLAGTPLRVTFTAQVVPVCRGIMSCLYGTLRQPETAAQVLECYRSFYREDPFVRCFDRDSGIGSMHVRGTNYCNLIVDTDERTRRLRVISHIDNLVKGQAGSALQNMNLMCGLPETMGLDHPGQYP